MNKEFFDDLLSKCVQGLEHDERHVLTCHAVVERFKTTDNFDMFKLLTESTVHLYKQVALVRNLPIEYTESTFTKIIQRHYIWPIMWTLLILWLYKYFFGNDGHVRRPARRR